MTAVAMAINNKIMQQEIYFRCNFIMHAVTSVTGDILSIYYLLMYM